MYRPLSRGAAATFAFAMPRARAERELGPKFDIRSFHDLLIGSGSFPLSILERQVDAWIASRK